jgi:hypothetical protein
VGPVHAAGTGCVAHEFIVHPHTHRTPSRTMRLYGHHGLTASPQPGRTRARIGVSVPLVALHDGFEANQRSHRCGDHTAMSLVERLQQVDRLGNSSIGG